MQRKVSDVILGAVQGRVATLNGPMKSAIMRLLLLSISTGEGAGPSPVAGAGRGKRGPGDQNQRIEMLDPSGIRFSHSKIYEKFSCGRYDLDAQTD